MKSTLDGRLQREAERLATEFKGIFGQETIERFLEDSIAKLENARVIEFVPILAGRFARKRLQAIARVEGSMAKAVPGILFVCIHNAGRSQMAAGFAQAMGGDRVIVRSAGSMPADHLNPRVIEAMAEVGIDITDGFPKALTDEVVEAADAVITMGCGDACPIFPGKRYLDWELDDPAEADMEGIRRIRDEIRERVAGLLDELGVEVKTSP